jgi:hypothetical protein
MDSSGIGIRGIASKEQVFRSIEGNFDFDRSRSGSDNSERVTGE